MNAAFLLMSTAALAGADVAPAPAAPAPAVISTGAGCSNCGTPVAAPCNDCGKTKVGLLDKLKARLGGIGKKSHHDCGCAPVAAPCNDCATTVAARPNLLDKLKSRLGHKKASACGPVCDPCAAAPVVTASPGITTPPTTTAPGNTPPKEMPKPKEETKPKPTTKDSTSLPLPLPPVTGASGLAGTGNPY